MPAPTPVAVGLFGAAGPIDLRQLGVPVETQALKRGAVLMRQHEAADALYVVVTGRFAVTVEGRSGVIAEIGSGEPIGEIAFLASGTRTATVTALRDSVVMRLGRETFDALSETNPSLLRQLTVALAQRLGATNQVGASYTKTPPRTIALIGAGDEPVAPEFVSGLIKALEASARTIAVGDCPMAGASAPPARLDTAEVIQSLNALEDQYDCILFIADAALTPWSEQAMRQADLILVVGRHGAPREPGAVERRGAELLTSHGQRLVLLHDRRGAVRGTAGWLASRNVTMHHHIALDTPGDFARLVRFINGTAIGLVACGGGAYSAAHIGLYQALVQSGVEFDIMGGTSGGAAMTAAFVLGASPDDIDRATHDVFVTNKAMGHWTWPRYSLIDHTHFDRHVSALYAGIDIEDMWLPYFAVSANLSLHVTQRHTTGDLWEAVRASSSIPVLLPPYYDRHGHMLVDGAIVDNVPVRVMHEMKSGPNIVVNFKAPTVECFPVDYDQLPGRWRLLAQLMSPLPGRRPPEAPGIPMVLMRSLMANRQDFERHLGPGDVVMRPPLPEDMGVMDWHRHTELKRRTFEWTLAEFAGLDAAIKAMLSNK